MLFGKGFLIGCLLAVFLSAFVALKYDEGQFLQNEVLAKFKRGVDIFSNYFNKSAGDSGSATVEVDGCTCEEQGNREFGSCRLKGTVSDCCCEYNVVNIINEKYLYPLVVELSQTAFFKYFKVNLYCDCPLWPDDGMCMFKSCSVCECDENEIPKPWILKESNHSRPCDTSAIEREFVVNKTVDPDIKKRLINLPGWRGFNNPWMPEDDKDVDYSYINLVVNPERFTGYQGDNSAKVWMAIYSQSCFSQHDSKTCAEKRIFYKLISGLHSSITSSVIREMLDEETNTWGPNLKMFEAKLGSIEVADRVDNMYFAFLFVLRAVMKAGPMLEAFDYDTGLAEEDANTSKLIKELIDIPVLKAACPVPFDEGRLWKGTEGPELISQLRIAFKNITRIMDCVGCEKCKLWGKVQTLGLATALKVLFHEHDCYGNGIRDIEEHPPLVLERNEVIALINTLKRLSESIETYRIMSIELEKFKTERLPNNTQ